MITGYIDRIEDDMAVIMLGEDEDYQIEIPSSMLPDNLHEGIYIKLDISYDEEKTKAALAEAMDLMK